MAKISSSKTGIIIAGIIAALIIIVIGWGISTSNSFVRLNEQANKDFAQIETTLQRRLDLIPNLVNTVKGYATHEETIFTEIAESRSKLGGAIDSGDVDAINKANSELSGSLSRLIAIAEAYPDLKANTVFIGLQDELAGTENRINTARQTYNDTVSTYNSKIKTFPNSIIAGMSNHSERKYFEADPAASTVPKVEF